MLPYPFLPEKRLHWRVATKASLGLRLTSPLNPFDISITNPSLVRPQELRLAIGALERLLILYPRNWSFRRDLGMMLYYDRKVEALEVFVGKLHLFRTYSSLKSPLGSDRLTVP